eukprot:scaffold731_cov261-Pinguiococcus_pyrenoidosus.AAC.18
MEGASTPTRSRKCGEPGSRQQGNRADRINEAGFQLVLKKGWCKPDYPLVFQLAIGVVDLHITAQRAPSFSRIFLQDPQYTFHSLRLTLPTGEGPEPSVSAP